MSLALVSQTAVLKSARRERRTAVTAFRTALIPAAAAFAVSLFAPFASAAVPVQVIAKSGDAISGGSPATLNTIDFPSINDLGQVSFDSTLSGTDAETDVGLFLADGNTVRQIAREGSTVPGGNGLFSSFTFSPPAINDAGHVASLSLLANTSGGNADNNAVFRSTGNALPTPLSTVAREGQPSPDGNGTLGNIFDSPTLNAAGLVGIRAPLTATLNGTADNFAILRADAGVAPTLIARKGQSTGAAGETIVGLPDAGELDNAGRIAFRASIAGGAAGSGDGIFIGDGAAPLAAVARKGQAVPGVAGGTFVGFSAAGLSQTGEAAFAGSIDNVPSTQTGVFRGKTAASLVPVVLAGQAAPGGGTFRSFFHTVDINGSGGTAFIGSVIGGPGFGDSIFRADGSGGATIRIATTGTATPGGRTFSTLFDPAINDAGQVAFQASLSEGGRGVYVYDNTAGLIEIAKPGDALLGSTIQDAFFAANQLNDFASGLNEQGQVAFGVYLTDGRSAVAVVSVPEPAALSLLFAAAPAMLRRRRG